MKKFYLIQLLLGICTSGVLAQMPSFEWAHHFGTTADIYVYDNDVDDYGNIYLTGEFSGTVDFDPGAGDASYAADATDGRDGFVLKLYVNGNFAWVHTFGGTGIDFGQRIAVDAAGQNIAVAGRYQGSLSFMNSTGLVGLGYSTGDYDAIVLKLDADGNLNWFRNSYGSGADFFTGVAIDSNGNVYACGSFNQATTLQTGIQGNYSFATTVGGTYDWLVTKIYPTGYVAWAYSFGNTLNDIAYNLKLTADETKVAICGEFNGTIDFEGKSGQTLNVSSLGYASGLSAFVQVLEANSGSAVWAKAMGTTESKNTQAIELAFDNDNNIYVGGRYAGAMAYFDYPNSSNLLLNAESTGVSFDAYLAKFSEAGSTLWVKGFGTSAMGQNVVTLNNDQITGVAVDASGNVYVVGTYNGLNGLDLDPSSATVNVTNYGSTAGTDDIFLLKLDNAGAYQWGTSFTGSNNNDIAWALTVDSDKNVIVAGYFTGTQVDVNPVSANGDGLITGNTSGSRDIFITKLSQSTAGDISVVNPLPDVYVVDDFYQAIDATGVFVDANEHTLTYTATSNNEQSVLAGFTTATDPTSLFILDNYDDGSNKNAPYGPVTVTVTATDANNYSASDEFIVSFETSCVVNIPDANFKNYLINSPAINTNGDSEIQCTEAAAYTGTLFINGKSIADLTGVEMFTSLSRLFANGNQITSVKLNTCTALTYVNLSQNQIAAIDLSANPLLTEVYVNNVTGLSSLNLANGNNTALAFLQATGNPNLGCIQVDDATYSQTTWRAKGNTHYSFDAAMVFSENCAEVVANHAPVITQINDITVVAENELVSYPIFEHVIDADNDALTYSLDATSSAKGITIVAGGTLQWAPSIDQVGNHTVIVYVNDGTVTSSRSFNIVVSAPAGCLVDIPDGNFKAYLIGNAAININGDSEIQCDEAAAFTGSINCSGMGIGSLSGIEAFVNITALNCDSNQLTALDLSSNTQLQSVNCASNMLSSINVTNCTQLSTLFAYTNQLTTLDLSTNTALNTLYSGGNLLTGLDLSHNAALYTLFTGNNTNLGSINLSANTNLNYLEVYNCGLTTLDVSTLTNLVTLRCENNQLTSLDLQNNAGLTSVKCQSNLLTSLDISTNTLLIYLQCSGNQLTSLNLANSNNSNFSFIKASSNPALTCVQVDDVNTAAGWTGNGNFVFGSGVTFSTNCTEANSAPVLTSISDLTVTAGEETINYSIFSHASDPDGDALSYDLDLASLSKGMNITAQGILQWVPDASQVGVHSVTVSVGDGSLTVSQSFNITVLAPDCAIQGVNVLGTSSCNAATNTYSAQIQVSYVNPVSGSLLLVEVSGMSYDFNLSASPMTVTLEGLPLISAEGAFVDLTVSITGLDLPCEKSVSQAWFAPGAQSCVEEPQSCIIQSVSVLGTSDCDISTSSYSAQLQVSFANPEATSLLHIEVSGLSFDFDLTASPMAVTLAGLPVLAGAGGPVDLFVEITDTEVACSASVNSAWFAPGEESCVSELPLGIDPAADFKIYPNPVVNAFPIDFSFERIQLVDLSGKTVRSWNQPQTIFDVSDLPAGVYTLIIQTKLVLITRKLIKN